MATILMADWNADFGPFDGHTWLNCAHQGPLPKRAVEAVDDAVTLKRAPHRLPERAFREVPAGVKRALGALINASPDEIILGNSFSYGLHLLIHGLEWNEGDEVILVEGGFPATMLPWQLLESQGGPTAVRRCRAFDTFDTAARRDSDPADTRLLYDVGGLVHWAAARYRRDRNRLSRTRRALRAKRHGTTRATRTRRCGIVTRPKMSKIPVSFCTLASRTQVTST